MWHRRRNYIDFILKKNCKYENTDHSSDEDIVVPQISKHLTMAE
jgi:hypothetical protein